MSVKNYVAGGTINKYRIVKFSADGVVVQGAAATDSIIGVVDIPALNVASGNRVDVVHDDIAQIEYGGTVTRGDLLTSDSVGRAITASPATGVNNRIIGVALVSGVASDVPYVLINLGSVKG
jgi:hypothetical protein